MGTNQLYLRAHFRKRTPGASVATVDRAETAGYAGRCDGAADRARVPVAAHGRRMMNCGQGQGREFVQADPTTRVSAPAIGLMVAGGLSAAFTLLYMLFVAVVGVAAFTDRQSADALPSVGIMMGAATIKLAMDALTIFAGYQMRQLRSWTLSMVGSIVALLPCSICCILGLPMGIWAIDQDVKRNFVS
jgi:hypothetical protein